MVGKDRVHPHVPGRNLQDITALRFMSQAEEVRACPVGTPQAEGERTIIKAPPHAEPMTLGVESEHRYQQQVQKLRLATVAVAEHRLGNVEAIEVHAGLRRPRGKPKPPVEEGMQYRQVTRFPHHVREMQQRHRVYFPLAADVAGHTPGGHELALQQQGLADAGAGALQFGVADLPACRAQRTTKKVVVRQGAGRG